MLFPHHPPRFLVQHVARERLAERDDGVRGVVEREHEAAAGTKHARQLPDGNGDVALVIEVVERRVRDDRIEALALEWQRT